MKKFEFTSETKTTISGIVLHRIKALVRIDLGYSTIIEVGDLGGWLEKEDNLSYLGSAWVSGDAEVFGDAKVFGDALISGYSRVFGNARIFGNARVYNHACVFGDAQVSGYAWIYGDAKVFDDAVVADSAWVFGDAEVSGYAQVFGDAEVHGNALISGYSRIFGNAQVSGDAEVLGDAKIYGDSKVSGDACIDKCGHILNVGPIGSRNEFTTFFRTKDRKIKVSCGCFLGTIDEFLEKVEQTHGDSKHAIVYRAAADIALAQIDTSDEDDT